MPVCSELHTARQPIRHVCHELVGVLGIAPTYEVADDKLAVGVESRPSPHVPSLIWSGLSSRHVLRLGVAERPNLIALDALGRDAPHVGLVVGRARFPGVFQQLRHGVDRHVHHAADRPHGGALAEHAQDLDALRERQPVHELNNMLGVRHMQAPLIVCLHSGL